MNRLTERCLNEEGKPFYRFTEDSGIEIRYRYCVGLERAIVRLGFYEDAGLEPEEIRALKAQLAESQRREKAAVEDIGHICHTCNRVDICKIKDNYNLLEIHTDATGQCNKWQWRGPVDEKGEETC